MNSNDYLRNARNLYDQKFYTDAIRECSKAIELEPNNAEAFELKGISYYNIEDTEKAIDNLNKAIQLNPMSSRAYCYRGICYSSQMTATSTEPIAFNKPSSFSLKGYKLDGNIKEVFSKALNDENQSISIDSSNIVPYEARGEIYFWVEDYERALVDLNKVIKEYPNDCQSAYETRAKIYFIFQNYDSAIEDCKKAIKLNSNSDVGFDVRGRSYYMKKDYDRAIVDFTMALNLNPSNDMAYYYRGCCYYFKDDNT